MKLYVIYIDAHDLWSSLVFHFFHARSRAAILRAGLRRVGCPVLATERRHEP